MANDTLEQTVQEVIHATMLEKMPNLVRFIQITIAKGYSKAKILEVVTMAADNFEASPSIRNNMLVEVDYLWENRE